MKIQDWESYIGALAGQPLWSKAIAANTIAFSDALRADGLTMLEVKQVMLLFVRQLVATGMKVPEGGAFDLVGMAEIDEIARRGATIDPQVVAQMAANPPPDEDLEDVWFNL